MEQDTSRNIGDLLLFSETFAFDVSASPAQCVQLLRVMQKPREGWGSSSRQVFITAVSGDTYDFDVRMLRRNRSWDYTSVKAVGRIESRHDKTSVHGKIQFGIIYFLGLIAAVVLGAAVTLNFLRTRPSSALLFAVIFAAIIVYYGWTLIKDRSSLKQLIYSALEVSPAQWG